MKNRYIEKAKVYFEEAGIKADSYGNYIIKGTSKTFRFKLNDRSFRIERKIEKSWCNVFVDTLYYSIYLDDIPELIKKAVVLSNKE